MNITLSTVLLFGLSIPFIMSYRIGPGDTPYALFTFIFILLLGAVFLDMFVKRTSRYYTLKNIVFWTTILSTVGAGFISAIVVRHLTHPIFQIHDIILQLEAAIRFFLDGINPYKTTYFGTFLEAWHYSDTQVNPALYHFVMEPFYLLFSIPFYAVSIKTIGFFDGRMPLFFLFFVLLFLASRLVKDQERRLQFISLLAFNPATLSYTLEGRSDIFLLTFLFAGLYLLWKEKKFLAGIFIGLSFMIKQSVWPFFPFYFCYIFFKNKKNVKKTILDIVPFMLTCIIIALPFAIWDFGAYINSTILYLSGNTAHSYPISGYGFGVLMHQIGVIKSLDDKFPFAIFQALCCIPLLIGFLKYQSKNNSIRVIIILYALFLCVYWYFSRYFNNSHIGYISMLVLIGYFWPDKKEEKT